MRAVGVFVKFIKVHDLTFAIELDHRDHRFCEFTERTGRNNTPLTSAQHESGPSILQLGLSEREVAPG